ADVLSGRFEGDKLPRQRIKLGCCRADRDDDGIAAIASGEDLLLVLRPAERHQKLSQQLAEPRQQRRIARRPPQRLEIRDQRFVPDELRALETAARAAQEILLRDEAEAVGITRLLGTGEL